MTNVSLHYVVRFPLNSHFQRTRKENLKLTKFNFSCLVTLKSRLKAKVNTSKSSVKYLTKITLLSLYTYPATETAFSIYYTAHGLWVNCCLLKLRKVNQQQESVPAIPTHLNHYGDISGADWQFPQNSLSFIR